MSVEPARELVAPSGGHAYSRTMTRYAIKNFHDTHDRLAVNPDRGDGVRDEDFWPQD